MGTDGGLFPAIGALIVAGARPIRNWAGDPTPRGPSTANPVKRAKRKMARASRKANRR